MPALAPIVVGGCHRSGTSLVRRVLDAHPRIHCGPELKFLLDFHGCFRGEDRFGHLRFVESARSILPEGELFDVLGDAFLGVHERAAQRLGKPRWADKAPENAIFLDDWGRLLGERWVFVQVTRNPLDTLASMAENPFPLTVPGDLDGRIEHYLRYTTAGVEFARLHPERYRRVVYEDLVRDPEAEVRALMEWLGEEFDPVQLRFNSVPHQEGLEDPKIAATAAIDRNRAGGWRAVLDRSEVERIRTRTDPVWSAIRTEAGAAASG